ncbi:hypothetical protein G7068_09100 [Leucobacter viscericola]|uniref:Uncharacterized protein n=1 Tax=Leucobacter viscericola TaxID=2714935 RepID=A0A6G7XG35_9MICO|nr:SdrD B-like domain-containing protein [Leucobacter viscericola]QIK63338.1 hypothetical protein G7068_09100 [Leucobacter viscericola]
MALTVGPTSASLAVDATQPAPTPNATSDADPSGDGTADDSVSATKPSADADDSGVKLNAASAGLPTLAMQVRIASDGTPTWDADSNAGNDSGPNNGIVRVNDTVTYEVEYVVADNAADNLTWSVTLPKGMELTVVPGYCQATGSSLVPADAGSPALPLSATSIDELSQQTLTCNMGNRSVATDRVQFTAKVLNLAHQGQALQVVAANVAADGIDEPVPATSPLPSVKASSRLKWDISKNSIVLGENSGYAYGPINTQCPWDDTITCKQTIYSVELSAPAGGKGAMPAVGDITFTDDLSPKAMYPGLSAASLAAINADLDKYGSRVTYNYSGYSQPGSKIGGSQDSGFARTAVNSVRDSGTLTGAQAGPGKPVALTISGADMSLRSYPTEALRPVGTAIPGNAAYAVSLGLTVYTPVAVIRDFGTVNAAKTSWTLPTYNAYTNLSIHGFEPATDVQTSASQPGPAASKLPAGVTGPVNWNDYRTTTPLVELTGSFRKQFLGLPGAPGNMSSGEFSPTNSVFGEGPPGGATLLSGGITVAPTQVITSQMFFKGSKPDAPTNVSAIGCDAWDNTKLNLQATNNPGVSGSGSVGMMQRIPSEGQAVWVSGYDNVPGSLVATSKSEVPNVTFQYSAAPAGATSAKDCGDAQGPWYDSPQAVPGNDPAMAAEGTYTGVARVRAFVNLPAPVSNSSLLGDGVYLAVSIGLRVADNGMATGTVVPNFGAVKMMLGKDLTPAQMLADPTAWNVAAYDPATHSGNGGDRLIVAHAQARIDKKVRKGDSGAFTSTPPQVTGGDMVQYQLSPSLTSGASTPGILKDVWVEDCLPASQAYSSATMVPAVVSQGVTPSDAQRPACGAGETYIRWVFPKHEVNTAIDPIVMSAEVSPTATDGVYTNTVVVWAEDDASTLAQRTDQAQIQISNIAGIKLEKIALTPVVQVNRPGQATNELNKWAVRLTNTLPASQQSGVSSPDVIDVLPKQGYAGTSYNGTFEFVSADVTKGGPQTRILYTADANVSANPADASNGAAGATTWCDAPANGTVVSGANSCPASAADVKAIRVQRPGDYLSGDVLEAQIVMVGVGNRADDTYVNSAMASVTGLENPVGPIVRPEVAVSSRVGDYVWWDFNRNGTQDDFNGAPEQPASGVTVHLAGTDDLGNQVAVDTQTDSDGTYSFDDLRASDAAGYVITFTKPDGSEFTLKHSDGVDPALDSDADTQSGISDPVVLDANAEDLTIDAGLLPVGDLQILKSLTGAGVDTMATSDTLKFEVLCTFEGEPVNLHPAGIDQPSADTPLEIDLPVNGASQLLSEKIGPIPAFSSCTVTEVDAGHADHAAAPVSVTIPWDAQAQKSGGATASLTNFYSAASIMISKKLDGDPLAVNAAKDKVFEILATCQIEETGPDNTKIRSTLYSGMVLVKGGQTKFLVGADNKPRMLPLGARCFGEEVDDGGAAKSKVDFGTWDHAAEVTSGESGAPQQLTITAVNTFKDAKITVSKKVLGNGTGGAYDFTLNCTQAEKDKDGKPSEGGYTLADADAKFSLKAGESRTITVPEGVTCRATEVNVPKNAKVSVLDSDGSTHGGASDGIIANATGSKNTVKVTNTFPDGIDSPSSLVVTGAQLGGIGVFAAALLLSGALLFVLRRRRQSQTQ